MKEEWLNKIRESQEDFSEPEPEGLWEGIEAGLSAEGGTLSGNESVGAGASAVETAASRRRSVRRWWAVLPAAAAAALVLFLSIPGQKGAYGGSSRTPVAADSRPSAAPEPFDVVPREAESSSPASLPAYSAASQVPSATGMSVATAQMPSEAYVAAETSRRPSEMTADSETASRSSEALASAETAQRPSGTAADDLGRAAPSGSLEQQETASLSKTPDNWPSENLLSEDETPVRKARRRGFSLGLLASNVAGSRSSFSEYVAFYGSTVTRQIHGFSETSADFPDIRGYAGVMQSNADNEISSEIRNFQPIQVGVNVAYSFTDRLSIESGLTYSCLISDLSSGTPSGNYDIRQTLHYIGIPLSIRYDFLKFRKFSLYASAGGQMEKCVAGKTRTDYFVGGKKISSESGSIMVEPLQWSVGAYVGAQYSFNRLVGLYVEPGAAYYFGNGSPVNCIYSERPFNFSIHAGLRFSLQR